MFRKIAVTIAAVGAATIFATPTATAETVTQVYRCGTVIGGGWYESWRMSITAPATAARGSTITLQATMEHPDRIVSYPANANSAELGIGLAGATSGGVTANLTNPELHSEPMRFTGPVQVTLANTPGDVAFRPANFRITWQNFGYEWCWIQGNPQTAATTRVV